MGVSRAEYDAGRNLWEDKPFTDIQAGTTQIRKVMIDGTEVWCAGIFTAAIVDDDGSGPIGLSAGNYTFNVISSTGSGTGGQIVGSVSSGRRLTGVVSVVDGGLGHEIGDTLVLEMVGTNWFQDPDIEVTAL